MKLKENKCLCCGEECLTLSEVERYRLNNIKISRTRMYMFFLYLVGKKKMKKPIKVIFSEKKLKFKGKQLWGITENWCRTITLYRHSVWVLLHEMAHIYQPKELHGPSFAKQLLRLHGYWKKFEKQC